MEKLTWHGLYRHCFEVNITADDTYVHYNNCCPCCIAECCDDLGRAAHCLLRVREAQEPHLHSRHQERGVPPQDPSQIYRWVSVSVLLYLQYYISS